MDSWLQQVGQVLTEYFGDDETLEVKIDEILHSRNFLSVQ